MSSFLAHRTLRLMLTLSYMTVLLLLSVLPGESSHEPRDFSWIITTTPSLVQNAMHVACYGVLAYLLFGNLRIVSGVQRMFPVAVAATVLCIAYGAALEYWQGWIPGRHASITDALLNGAGAVIGTAIGLRLERISRRS